MNYIYSVIQNRIPEIPKEYAETIIKIMVEEGYISMTTEQHFEIYTFYKEKVSDCKTSNYPLKVAMVDTMDHFNVSRELVYKICRDFEKCKK
jgi:hypothetical protein